VPVQVIVLVGLAVAEVMVELVVGADILHAMPVLMAV